jgi:hypothetical protein
MINAMLMGSPLNCCNTAAECKAYVKFSFNSAAKAYKLYLLNKISPIVYWILRRGSEEDANMKRLLMQLSYAMTVCLIVMLSPVTALAADNTISDAELDQMLAPIALYPDTVLTHILIASTYPLEVVQADRWAKRNKKLSSQAAVDAVEDESWDPSVKALVAFPQILARLSDDLNWTEQLGEAFLQDETQVLARVQLLRHKADKQGSLNDTQHVVVERDREVIIIEPARKEVVYVPVYDTRVVYGNWWWPAYPPVYWHNVGGHYSNHSVSWGVSVNVNPWFYFGVFDWHQRHIIVNHNYYYSPPRYYPRRRVHFTNSHRWYHDSYHRRGVHYRHPRLNKQYNGGYGPKQYTQEYKGTRQHTGTREYKGQPNRGYRNEYNLKRELTRETGPVYQRRSAEQVNIPNRFNAQPERPVRRRDHATTTRELRNEQRAKMPSVNNAQPVERTQRRAQHAEDTRIKLMQDRPASAVISQQQRALSQRPVANSQQQQRTISTSSRSSERSHTVRQQPAAPVVQQARPRPERQMAKPAVRESQPHRQTVISRRQDQRSID